MRRAEGIASMMGLQEKWKAVVRINEAYSFGRNRKRSCVEINLLDVAQFGDDPEQARCRHRH